MRELLSLGYRNLQELAQRLPTLAHLVLKQVLRGHESAKLGVVVVEDLLAVFIEVAFEKRRPEFVQHGCVEARAPVPLGHEFELEVVGAPVYCLER